MSATIDRSSIGDHRYDVVVDRNIRIPSSVPGLSLGADLYRPNVESPVPALVTLYSGRKDSLGGIGHRKYLRYFSERGYATLYVECFGVGSSDGIPRPMLSPSEVDDAESVIEWASRQPWCTGKVGMWGGSHGGMITLATASRRPKNLAAICSIMGTTNIEQDLAYPGGSRSGMKMFAELGVYDLLGSLLPNIRKEDISESADKWLRRASEREPWIIDAWRHGPGNEVWRQREYDPSRIVAPSMLIAGWRDFLCDSMVCSYEAIPARKRLLIGPWLHGYPDSQPLAGVGWTALALEWWGCWLGDVSSSETIDEPVTLHIQGANSRWVRAERWPIEPARQRHLLATSNGALVCAENVTVPGALNVRGSVDKAKVRMATDPSVGALSGITLAPGPSYGLPIDQHDDDMRSMVFTSSPLDERLVLVGRPRVALVVSSETTARTCVVKLTDVDRAGRSRLISIADVDLSALTGRSGGFEIDVEFDPTCYAVDFGHALRLVISGSDFPRLWPDSSITEMELVTLEADGSRATSNGYSDIGVTAIRLTIADEETFDEGVTLPPVSKKRSPHKAQKANIWQVTRDHGSDSVRTRMELSYVGPYAEGGCELWQRDQVFSSNVRIGDPTSARISALGVDRTVNETGDELEAKASIDISHTGLMALGEVRVNGVRVFSKKWRAEDR